MIAVLSLNPAIDKIVAVKDLRWGEHIRVKNVKKIPAGKGINVARVIKKLGMDVVVIGVSGGPNGEWIERELRKEKIKFDFVPFNGNVRESLTIMDEKRAREIHLSEEGPVISQGELALLKKRIKKWSPKLKFLVISGRLPKGVPVDFYREVITFFKKRNVPVLLDANGPGFVRALGAGPDYIKPNLVELEEAAGRKLRRREDEVRFIKSLLKRGVNTAIVTHGPGDVLIMNSRTGLVLKPPRVRAKNTVGSGDAVTGAIAYGFAKGVSPSAGLSIRIFKLAVACGTANTLSVGAGFFDIKKVNALIKKVNVKVLYNEK